MPTLRIQHSFQGASGTPDDRYVNVWYASTADAVLPSDYDALANAVHDFYQLPSGLVSAPQALTYWLNSTMDGPTAMSCRVYDMADPLPRAPKTVVTRGIDIPVYDKNLPTEVAICMSYAAVGLSGTNPARRKGRLYLGPFNTRILDAPDNDRNTVVDDKFMDNVLQLAKDLSAAFHALAPNFTWCQYSPTTGLASKIDSVWIDNAFDTQRRRGVAPTARQTVQIAP